MQGFDRFRRILLAILAFLLGGAIGCLLILVPVQVLVVFPLLKLFGHATETNIVTAGLLLILPSFVTAGMICAKGVLRDMVRYRNLKSSNIK
jgi:hypothetical protein